MKRLHLLFEICFSLFLVAVLFLHLSLTHSVSASGWVWNIVPSQNPSSVFNQLDAMSSTSSSTNMAGAWAVGYSGSSSGFEQTLIEVIRFHSNGNMVLVPSPNIADSNNELHGVSVINGQNAWAVGDYFNAGTIPNQTLIEQLSGVTWNIIPSPNPQMYNVLNAVTAVSSTDVWAVGGSSMCQTGCPSQTLIEQWDGTSWNVIQSPPSPSDSEVLKGIVSVAANDIWAVGSSSSNGGLVEHWDGTSWSIVSSPTITNGSLNGVAAISSTDIWVVGSVIEHWDGVSWSLVSSPNTGILTSIAVGTTNLAKGVWAVGYTSGNGISQTLIEHWNGSVWKVVASPNPGISNQLTGIAWLRPTDRFWVSGFDTTSPTQQTLALTCKC